MHILLKTCSLVCLFFFSQRITSIDVLKTRRDLQNLQKIKKNILATVSNGNQPRDLWKKLKHFAGSVPKCGGITLLSTVPALVINV